MKRLHIALTTADLPRSVAFYSELFDNEPTVLESDYAKWMLDDPRVNFTLSTHGDGEPGIDHLGIQAEVVAEFESLRARLRDSAHAIFEQEDVTCCYARSSKAWIRDPDGVAWETFISHGASPVYGDRTAERAAGPAGVVPACCDSERPSDNCCNY